jgi:hypothetical protein
VGNEGPLLNHHEPCAEPTETFSNTSHRNSFAYCHNRNKRNSPYNFMSNLQTNPHHLLAFLSIREYEQLGACGGLLIVNANGRPLEFHCTSPVLPSRTQAILFGQTLSEFVYCEQIAESLIKQLKASPLAVLTNSPELSKLNIDGGNLIFVSSRENTEPHLVHQAAIEPQSNQWELDGRELRAWQADGMPPEELSGILRAFHQRVPIDEPFERIAQALDEACQASFPVAS